MSKQAARWAAGPNGRSDIMGRVDVLELCGLRSSSTDQRQQQAHMQAQHIMSVAEQRATRTFRLMLCMATSIATGWPIFEMFNIRNTATGRFGSRQESGG